MNVESFESEILLITDIAEDSNYLSRILSGYGYKVRCSNRLSPVLADPNGQKPVLILVDSLLMETGDYSYIFKEAQSESDLPFILIGLPQTEGNKLKGICPEGTDFINRPFVESEVITRVNNQLNYLRKKEELEHQRRQLAGRISELTKREEELKEIELRYMSLFDNMSEGLAFCKMVYDGKNPVDFIYINVNNSFEKQTGLKNVVGKKVSEVIPGILETDSELIEIYSQVARTGVPSKFEFYVEAMKMWFSLSIYSPEKDYFVAVFDVINERKKVEKELEIYRNHLEEIVKLRTEELDETNTQLRFEIERGRQMEMVLQAALSQEKELSRMKSRFISTVSHEFRTPLTSIYSSAELIERYGVKWDPAKFSEHLDRIKSSVDSLLNLFNDVLTISKSETGKTEFSPILTDLYRLCLNILDDIKHKFTDLHKMGFNYLAEELNFSVDPKLIRFIIMNLISNALKYSPAGGTVSLNISASAEKIFLNVTDQGIGIPEKDRRDLFEPFQRASNVIEFQGSGLGLSIVKHAVELHNGTICFKSELGKGTTFMVELPLKIK